MPSYSYKTASFNNSLIDSRNSSGFHTSTAYDKSMVNSQNASRNNNFSAIYEISPAKSKKTSVVKVGHLSNQQTHIALA